MQRFSDMAYTIKNIFDSIETKLNASSSKSIAIPKKALYHNTKCF